MKDLSVLHLPLLHLCWLMLSQLPELSNDLVDIQEQLEEFFGHKKHFNKKRRVVVHQHATPGQGSQYLAKLDIFDLDHVKHHGEEGWSDDSVMKQNISVDSIQG